MMALCAPIDLNYSKLNYTAMKHFNLLKTLLLLCALIVGSLSSWADEVKKQETFSFSTSGCSGWSTDNAGSYCGGYGRNKNGNYYVANASIDNFKNVNFSGVNNPSVTIYVKALVNGGTNQYTVSLIDKDGKVVGTPVVKTGGMGSGTNAASAQESSVVLIPVSGTTGYRIDFLAKSAITQTKYTLTYDPAPASPTFDPAEGEFSDGFTLHLACATEGSTIYYTTDGSTPTTSSTLYNDAAGISINAGANVTVKAIAVKNEVSSAVASATYTYKNIASPMFAIASGSTVLYGESVGISCATDGAEVYYTTNGDTPTSASTKYTAPIVLTEATTIKAIAINGGDESEVVSATYSVKATVPTFSIAEGIYNTTQSVSLGSTTDGATIYYTIDGSNPTSSSTVYSTAIDVTTSTTIKAIAIKAGLTDSEIASAAYTLKVLAPTFSVAEGDYDDEQNVELSCATDGAKIYYTFSGTPSSKSTLYSGAINVSDIKTIRAIAIKDGWTDSDVATAEYRVVIPASLPFSFDKGKSDIANTTGLTQDGLGSDYSSKPYLKFDHADDNLILKFNACPSILSFDIKGNGFSGGVFKLQCSEDGSTYTDLKEYTSLGDTKTESIDNIPATARYIKWIYTNKVSGNVGLGNIALKGTESISITAAGFATYASDKALDYTSVTGLKAYKATVSGTTITFDKITTVPAGEGVLLQGDEGTYEVPVISGVTPWAADDNAFVRGTGATVATGDGPYNYILNKVNGVVGFYKANGQTVAKNRAYLQSTTAAARISLNIDDETTGISEVVKSDVNNKVFDMQGRHIAQPTKGLYIMNGRKVLVK